MTIVQVQTHVRCDGCGAESPAAAGIVLARTLARQQGWRADGSRKPDLCRKCIHREETIEEYQKLVRRIGPGFHPDTPYNDYVPPLDWISEAKFQSIMDNIFGLPKADPYELGMKIWEME